jgi:hypothetical protein
MIAARVFTPVGISIARERITSVEGGNRMAVERAVENSSSGSNPAEEKRSSRDEASDRFQTEESSL